MNDTWHGLCVRANEWGMGVGLRVVAWRDVLSVMLPNIWAQVKPTNEPKKEYARLSALAMPNE